MYDSILEYFFDVHLFTQQDRSNNSHFFALKVYKKINNIKIVHLCSTFGILYLANFRNVNRVFTEERQLEPLWSNVIRVVPLSHPVPLIVMVICQQETEHRVHRHTAVFVLAVVLLLVLIRHRRPVIEHQNVIVTEGKDVSMERD